jgi:hypothetical protein
MTIPHAIGQEEALERMKKESKAALEAFGDRVTDVKQEWNDNRVNFSFSAMSFSIEGNMEVNSDSVALSAKLPMAAFMFKGMIEERIRERFGEVLA